MDLSRLSLTEQEMLHQELITVREDVLYISKELQKANPDIDYLRRRVNDVSLGIKGAIVLSKVDETQNDEGGREG